MVEILIITILITLMGFQLKQLDSIQYLGIYFGSQLKFHKHIDDKINKAYF